MRPVGQRPACGVRHHTLEAAVAPLGPGDRAPDHEPGTLPPQRRGHRLVDANARNRRRQGRHFEDRVPEPCFELAPDLSRASDTEHGRKADDLARDEIAVELGQN